MSRKISVSTYLEQSGIDTLERIPENLAKAYLL